MNRELFRERLREVIENSKMTQSELARSAGIHPSTLQRYMRTNCMPSTIVIFKLRERLKFDIDWLVGRK